MVYADELVNPEEVPGLEELAEIEVSDAEMAMAGQLIESLAGDFEAEQYRDSYREQVIDLLEQKASGEIRSIEAAPAAEEAAVVDLLAALEASVSAAKEARKKTPKTTKKSRAKRKKADVDDEAAEAKSA
jgi:DNA end-binding protein Ku